MRRTQIYLSAEEMRVLAREARRTGKSKAALVREAVDRTYGVKEEAKEVREFIEALDAVAGTWTEEDSASLRRLRRSWRNRMRRLYPEERS